MLNHFLSRINLFLTFLSPHLSLDLFLWLTRHFFSLVQSFHFGFLSSLPSCSSTCIIVTTIKQHISINYFLLYIFYIPVLYLVGYCIAPLLLKWLYGPFFRYTFVLSLLSSLWKVSYSPAPGCNSNKDGTLQSYLVTYILFLVSECCLAMWYVCYICSLHLFT